MARNLAALRTDKVERLLRRDNAIVIGSVCLIILAACWYTVAGIGMNMSAIEMTRMARPIGEPMQMRGGVIWNAGYAVLIFLMWWVMMIAMMTPSAAPTVLLYTALKRMGPEADRIAWLSLLFLTGYLIAWAAFSAAATFAQWGLELAGLSDGPMMTIRSKGFAGAVLIAAGLYQLSTLKTACLRHCRSPGQFLAEHSRPGPWGAFRTGALHGTYCLGCCWALMLLLFVGGIMNLYWIVGVALYVAAEKLMPRATWLVPLTGMALFVMGVWLIATPWVFAR
ncbi:DUF2182 domain-containing protein [Ruegeria sp.]|uniref:DUF2182 domain-containing protein n=1 Tax=Ruegeria sp. TaxID=1879320 RepID=UPI003C7AD91E